MNDQEIARDFFLEWQSITNYSPWVYICERIRKDWKHISHLVELSCLFSTEQCVSSFAYWKTKRSVTSLFNLIGVRIAHHRYIEGLCHVPRLTTLNLAKLQRSFCLLFCTRMIIWYYECLTLHIIISWTLSRICRYRRPVCKVCGKERVR